MYGISKPVVTWSVHILSAFCYLNRATAFQTVVTWAEQEPFNLVLPKPSYRFSACWYLSRAPAFQPVVTWVVPKPLNLLPGPCHSLSTCCYLSRATAFEPVTWGLPQPFNLLLTEACHSLSSCCYLSRATAFQPVVTWAVPLPFSLLLPEPCHSLSACCYLSRAIAFRPVVTWAVPQPLSGISMTASLSPLPLTLQAEFLINKQLFMTRYSRVVRASDSLCRSPNSPGFDPKILLRSGIWGAAGEPVVKIVLKNTKNPTEKKEFCHLRQITFSSFLANNFSFCYFRQESFIFFLLDVW
jgi:hypothetical protein